MRWLRYRLARRVATDLRVSLTDRCNLRCSYCMPAEGLDWLPRPELLTDDELVRLIRVAVERLGVTEVRFTGGEPLLRRGLPGIVAGVAALTAAPGDVAHHQRHRAGPAGRAAARGRPGPGQRVPGHPGPATSSSELARRDRLADVLAGLTAAAARRAGPGQGQRGADARRQRPRGGAAAAVLPGARVSAAVHRADAAGRPARLAADRDGHRRRDPGSAERGVHAEPEAGCRAAAAPAEAFLVDGGPATVGVIASVTRPFCGACDRVRLTADGQLRNCLFARDRERPAGRRCGPERPTTTWPPQLAARGRGQAARPRHQRSRLPAAGPADVGHRRLRPGRAGRPGTAPVGWGIADLPEAPPAPRSGPDPDAGTAAVVRPPEAVVRTRAWVS